MSKIKIKDIDSLREHSIELIKQLENGTVSTSKAMATVKIYDAIINGVKLQLQYAHLKMHEPNIPFAGDCLGKSKLITIQEMKKLDVKE